MRRVLVPEAAQFFDEVKGDRSLRRLALVLDVPHTSMKSWYHGKYLIPEDVFLLLLRMSKKPDYWEKRAAYKEWNWGRSKGGMERVSRLSTKSLQKHMVKMRSCRSSKPPISITLNESFCELFGAAMGDGCLSRYPIFGGRERRELIITGDRLLDAEYHAYLARLMKCLFGISPRIYAIKHSNSRKISVINKRIFELFVSYGFPVGKKGDRMVIPASFACLRWRLLRRVIRGIFDTDGCFTAKKNEGYRYPFIIITSMSKPLIRQLHDILRKHDYPAYIKKGQTELRIRGARNATRWMDDIGSSNSRHLKKYYHWKEYGVVPVTAKMGL